MGTPPPPVSGQSGQPTADDLSRMRQVLDGTKAHPQFLDRYEGRFSRAGYELSSTSEKQEPSLQVALKYC